MASERKTGSEQSQNTPWYTYIDVESFQLQSNNANYIHSNAGTRLKSYLDQAVRGVEICQNSSYCSALQHGQKCNGMA